MRSSILSKIFFLPMQYKTTKTNSTVNTKAQLHKNDQSKWLFTYMAIYK